MMKVIYACLMVLFFTPPLVGVGPVFAQDQQPPSAEDIVSKMQSKLNLTQDQVTAITPIIEKYSSKREELRQSMEDGTAEGGNIHSQMKELIGDEKKELGQVLSADQLSQWEQMQKQHRHKHSDGQSQGNEVEGNGGSDNGR